MGHDMKVTVILPLGFSADAAGRFVDRKARWIKKSLDYFSSPGRKRFQGRPVLKSPRREYLNNKEAALKLAKAKVLTWNELYNFSHSRVAIRNQKTRWGSCSKKGNLNFNYKIIRLPENLLDYLVVHELCHLKELNHSKNFWSLVAIAVPDYKSRRSQLRQFSPVS